MEPDSIKQKTGLAYPHTSHCLANGQVMISMMGDPNGKAKGIIMKRKMGSHPNMHGSIYIMLLSYVVHANRHFHVGHL